MVIEKKTKGVGIKIINAKLDPEFRDILEFIRKNNPEHLSTTNNALVKEAVRRWYRQTNQRCVSIPIEILKSKGIEIENFI